MNILQLIIRHSEKLFCDISCAGGKEWFDFLEMFFSLLKKKKKKNFILIIVFGLKTIVFEVILWYYIKMYNTLFFYEILVNGEIICTTVYWKETVER